MTIHFFPFLVIFSIFLFCVEANSHETKIKDFTFCESYSSWANNGYKQFFKIDEVPNESDVVGLNFSVKTSRDAHILLAPSSFGKHNKSAAYEVVIGAGNNTYTCIRRNVLSDLKETEHIKNLVSQQEVRSFWIRFNHRDGVVAVGKEGVNTSFITWKDPNPIDNIKLFSFNSYNVNATWYFGCKQKEKGSKNSERKEEKFHKSGANGARSVSLKNVLLLSLFLILSYVTLIIIIVIIVKFNFK